MVVTVVIGILAMIAGKSFQETREKAMMSAVRAELSNAVNAVERFRVVYGPGLPNRLAQLEEFGYGPSPNIEYCTWTQIGGAQDEAAYLEIEAMYRGMDRSLRMNYPRDGMQMFERPAPDTCELDSDNEDDAAQNRPGNRPGQARGPGAVSGSGNPPAQPGSRGSERGGGRG